MELEGEERYGYDVYYPPETSCWSSAFGIMLSTIGFVIYASSKAGRMSWDTTR